eukprot:snap_masked-scaffold_1-processed-gene-15.36-mRNA-1 protein AED:1.00 eAED:1.00 QI:0/0/0/0/1/1/2/0/86
MLLNILHYKTIVYFGKHIYFTDEYYFRHSCTSLKNTNSQKKTNDVNKSIICRFKLGSYNSSVQNLVANMIGYIDAWDQERDRGEQI